MNIRETDLCDVSDEETRKKIIDLIDQEYWSDNGGDPDGSYYLIEADELTGEQIAELCLTVCPGACFDEYEYIHQEVLDDSGYKWTGWQAEGYALVLAPVASVQQLFL